MPCLIVHEFIAKGVIRFFNDWTEEDKRRFLIGTLLPDSWRNTEEFKNSTLSKMEKRNKSHFHIKKDEDEVLENYKEYYKKYKSHMKDPFYLGYYTHLMADHIWKKSSLRRDLDRPIYSKGKMLQGSKKEIKKVLEEDVKKASRELKDIFTIEKVSLVTDDEISMLPKLKEIDYSGINQTISCLNQELDKDKEKSEFYDVFQVFTVIVIIIGTVKADFESKGILNID